MNLEELEQLEAAATPGPWVGEQCYVYGPKDSRSSHKNGCQLITVVTDMPYGKGVSFPPHNADAALIAAARNALPALLRVARAARAYIAVRKEWDAFLDLPRDDDEIAEALALAMDDAEGELRAALAALEMPQ